MSTGYLSPVEPAAAPSPPDVAWPTTTWPRGTHSHQAELEAVVDQAFSDEDLAITNAVVVIQGGRVLVERYGGVREFFDRPPEPITASSQLLSWSMAKSMLHLIIGTLVDEGRLDPDAPAPVPEWEGEGDPRRAIRCAIFSPCATAWRSSRSTRLGETQPRDRDALRRREGGHGGLHRPDSLSPTSPEPSSTTPRGTTNVLSRIVADQVGYGEAYREYLERRLFGPLGMTSAEATFDPTGRLRGLEFRARQRARLRQVWTAVPTRRRVGRSAVDLSLVGGHRAGSSQR